jgi:hypothetical protein
VDFVAVLDQVIALLRQRGRLTYSTLKRQFQLDEAALEDVKNELIAGQRLAVDERGNVLVWTGDARTAPSGAYSSRAAPAAPAAPPQPRRLSVPRPLSGRARASRWRGARLGHALLSVRQGVPCGACGPTSARGGRTRLVEKAV